jgi:Tfp pilus assembly protein PilF
MTPCCWLRGSWRGWAGKGKSAEALHAEAAAHYFAGDHNKAEKIYQQALQVNPRHLRTLCNYGALLQNARNEFDRAEELYQAALSVDPADAVTLYNYGLLLENARSDFKGAERMYQRALNSDPKHVDTLCNYGALLKTAYGEYETAKDMYEAALQVDAQHVDTLCNYALLCRDALHDKPKAAQLIKRALAIAPNDEWLQRHAKSFDWPLRALNPPFIHENCIGPSQSATDCQCGVRCARAWVKENQGLGMRAPGHQPRYRLLLYLASWPPSSCIASVPPQN